MKQETLDDIWKIGCANTKIVSNKMGSLESVTPFGITKEYIQNQIIILLSNSPLHGYEIWNRITQTYGDIRLNTLYRWLRDLEERKMIVNTLHSNPRGPDRKVYILTHFGKRYLTHLVGDSMNLVLETYSKYMFFAAINLTNFFEEIDPGIIESRILYGNFRHLSYHDYYIINYITNKLVSHKLDILRDIPYFLGNEFNYQCFRGNR